MATSAAAQRKEGIFSRIVNFLKGSWAELKKVHWPSRERLFTYTGVVIITVVVMTIAVWLADSLFSFLLGLIL